MHYQQLQLTVPKDRAEYYSEYLESLGALSVTWQDATDIPIYEPLPQTHPLWEQVIVTALFQDTVDIALIKATIDISPIDVKQIPDENWVEKNLQDFKPIHITEHFWICPSWQELNLPSATIVRLNPGLAFGTGEHATTQMILRYLSLNPPRNHTVLDFGCGSGILAISAAILGANSVYAVDIDPQALVATRNNARLNQLDDDHIHICLPEELPLQQFDQLLANIFLTPLLDLHNIFAKLIKPKGNVLLSGVLASQFDTISAVYSADFDLTIVDNQEDWLLIQAFLKKN
jgi:ribosomal protein L11 methyltransferase